MLRQFILLLTMFHSPLLFAEDAGLPVPKSPDEISRLMNRLESLEKRIKALEQQVAAAQAGAWVPQYYAYVSPPQQPYQVPANSPLPYYQQAPGSHFPYSPQAMPSNPAPEPYPTKKAIPDSWKPFNFNGMQYYIIPVNEAERMKTPSSS